MNARRTLAHELATQIAPLAQAWRQAADRVLASLGLSSSESWALVHLERLGEGVRQGDLARAIGIAEASLVRTIKHLEQGGLVTRKADAQDRRANRLHFTPTGAALARQAEGRLILLRLEMLEGLPDDDLEAAVRVLNRVSERAGAVRGRP